MVLDSSSGKVHYIFYQKPTHSGKYLHYTAHCSMITKINLIKSEAKRIVNNCMYKEHSWPFLEKLKTDLSNSGYPGKFINQHIITAISELHANGPPKPKRKFDFLIKIPYISENFTRIVQKNMIKLDINARVVVKPGQELKHLIKKKPSNPCDCLLCKNDIPCKTKNVIYKATCKHCSENYIGCSQRPINIRLREHGGSIRKRDDRSSLATHMKEKHPRNQSRNQGRGTAELDHQYLLKKYNMAIIGKQNDQLGTFILEGLKIKQERPAVNGMAGNGFIR